MRSICANSDMLVTSLVMMSAYSKFHDTSSCLLCPNDAIRGTCVVRRTSANPQMLVASLVTKKADGRFMIFHLACCSPVIPQQGLCCR